MSDTAELNIPHDPEERALNEDIYRLRPFAKQLHDVASGLIEISKSLEMERLHYKAAEHDVYPIAGCCACPFRVAHGPVADDVCGCVSEAFNGGRLTAAQAIDKASPPFWCPLRVAPKLVCLRERGDAK